MVTHPDTHGKPTKDNSDGRLHGVAIDIEEANVLTDFEVIEIVDDSNPYPELLEINWDFDMNAIINLKKRRMVFENNGLRVVVPLDLAEGVQYKEPVCDDYDDEDIDHIYKLTI